MELTGPYDVLEFESWLATCKLAAKLYFLFSISVLRESESNHVCLESQGEWETQQGTAWDAAPPCHLEQ